MRTVARPKPQPRGPNPYGWKHQKIAKEILGSGAQCAKAYLGDCKGRLQAAHIIPWDPGNGTYRSNYRPLCQRHNLKERRFGLKKTGRFFP